MPPAPARSVPSERCVRLARGRRELLGCLLGTLGTALAAAPARAAPRDSCIECHLEAGEEVLVAPARDFTRDIHFERGLGCASCHGGDPSAPGMQAMSPAKGFVGTPTRQQIPKLCGRCHSDPVFMRQYNPSIRIDQVAEYRTSVHGQRLELDDAKVATCTSCHTAHRILPAWQPESSVHPRRVPGTCGRCHGDPKYMEGYGIPTDQLERYRGSVHWRALDQGNLAAPACNSCHGNHGAVPPGFASVGSVCGQCHSLVADLFAKSPHARAFTRMETPGCAGCHEEHGIRQTDDRLLGLGEGAFCAKCHSEEDGGGKAAAVMRERIDALRVRVDEAQATLGRAERAGMEVSQARFELGGAQEALIKARAAVHAASPQAVSAEVEPGFAISEAAYARGLQALKDLQFRRRGLAISVVVIAALIAGLLLKIREIDRRRKPSPPTGGAHG